MNKPVEKISSPANNAKNKKLWLIVGSVLLALALIWIVLTVVTPLMRGNGLSKFSGLQKDIATNIVDLSSLYNGPRSPSPVPSFAYQVSVDDIHPVSQEEIAEYCKDSDPAYISKDPANARYYTAVVTEQYLFALPKTTLYVGCDPRDYIHVQVFGIPESADSRVRNY